MSIDASRLLRSLWPLLDAVAEPQPLTELGLTTLLEQLVASAAEVLEVDAVGITLLDQHDHPRVVAVTHAAARDLELGQAASHHGPGLDAMARSVPVAVTDLRASRRYRALWDTVASSAVRGALSSPVRIGESVVGTFSAVTQQPRPWSVDHIRVNDAFAHVVGLALMTVSLRAAAA